MFSLKILVRPLWEDKRSLTEIVRRICVGHSLNKENLPDDYSKNRNFDTSLFYTTLPKRRKVRKSKVKSKAPLPAGPLLISCKREEFNHYKGMQYGKSDEIPLASKSWHNRASKGDFFKILPTTDHPAFLSFEKLPLTFEEIGVNSRIIEELKLMGAHYPTTIQAKAIPPILEGNNTLVAAETGCGKTFAYLVPIVQHVTKWKDVLPELHNAPFAVIMLPTRELAMQVGEVAVRLTENLGLKCLINIGVRIKARLLKPEMSHYDILVCTPGVLQKFMIHKLVSMKRCKHVVVDEADTLMDDSFSYLVKVFFRKSGLRYIGFQSPLPNCAQACFVSATMPSDADSFLEDVCPASEVLRISTTHLHKIQPHITQEFLRVSKLVKAETLLKLVRRNVSQKIPTMIFSNNTKTCNWVSLFLQENNIKVVRINSKVHPEERLMLFQSFKSGEVDVISCTDIASRGLDTTRVKHVINFDIPRFLADYIHRCGRTGRINHSENCLITSLITKASEVPLVNHIEKVARMDMKFPTVRNNITRELQKKHLKVLEMQDSVAKTQIEKEKKEVEEAEEENVSDEDVAKSQV